VVEIRNIKFYKVVKDMISIQVLIFFLFLGKWRDIASLYMGRAEACAIVYMEKIYIFGGVGVFRQDPQSI
jgi:N-acetylneuraminic acid mutarotase